MKSHVVNHYTYFLASIGVTYREEMLALAGDRYDPALARPNDPFEHPVGPSKTVPGMTLSIQELLKRYVRGENVTVFEPQFTDDPEFDGIENMSTMDRLEAADNIKRGIFDFQSRKAEEKAERKKADEVAAAAVKAAESKTSTDEK